MARPQKLRGVYTITCKANGRQYVGSAQDIRNRWGTHRWALRHGKHRNLALQADWDDYGEHAFEFRTLAEVREAGIRRAIEQAYLDQVFSTGLAYNRNPSAMNSLGRKFTEEQRETLSLALTGRSFSPEHRAALSESAVRYHATLKGTPEMREQMAAMGRGNLGKPKTADHRKNMGLAQRVLTDDQIREIGRRLAAGEKGTRLAPEYKVHQTTISNIKRGKLRPADEAT